MPGLIPSSRGVRPPSSLPADMHPRVHSRARRPLGRSVPDDRSRSVFAVSHRLDGLLLVNGAGLLHPAAGRRVRRVSRLPCGPDIRRPVRTRVSRDALHTPRRIPLVSSRAASPRSLPSCLSHQSARTVRCGRPAPAHGVRSRTRSRQTGEPVGRYALPASSPRPWTDLAVVRRVRVDARERLAGPAGPRLVGGGERTSAGIRCRAPGCDNAPVPVLDDGCPIVEPRSSARPPGPRMRRIQCAVLFGGR